MDLQKLEKETVEIYHKQDRYSAVKHVRNESGLSLEQANVLVGKWCKIEPKEEYTPPTERMYSKEDLRGAYEDGLKNGFIAALEYTSEMPANTTTFNQWFEETFKS